MVPPLASIPRLMLSIESLVWSLMSHVFTPGCRSMPVPEIQEMPAGAGRGIRGAPPPRRPGAPACPIGPPIGPGGGLPLTPSGPICTPPVCKYGGPPSGTVVCWPNTGIPPNIMPPPIAAAVAAIMLLTNLRRDSMSINNSLIFPGELSLLPAQLKI